MKKSPNHTIYDTVLTLTKNFFSLIKATNKEDSSPAPVYDLEQLNQFYINSPTIYCVYNHHKFNYDYFSPNTKDIMGFENTDFLDGGLKFAMSLVHPEHTLIYNRFVLPIMFKYLSVYILKSKVKDLRFTYTFKIKRKDGEYIWALHHMNAIETNKLGLPKLTMLHISDVTEIKKDENIDVAIFAKDDDGIFKPVYSRIFSNENNSYSFSKKELEILTSLAQGKTSKQIAYEMGRSLHTISTHRRNMLEKSNLKNTSELIQMAMSKGLIMKKQLT